jgi:hypothetical protein
MSVLRLLFVLVIVFIFAGFIFVSPVLASSGQETASSVITTAENAIVSAYDAVLKAEEAGGNVSGLFARLNEAGEFFAAARMSYENEDFDDATLFANLSRNVGEEVGNEAYELEDWARNDSFQRTWFTILASVSGIVFVGLGSLWAWRFLKRRYQ